MTLGAASASATAAGATSFTVGNALAIGGAAMSGVQAYQTAQFEADQAKANAANLRMEAEITAEADAEKRDLTRRRVRSEISRARTSIAAGNVKLGVGTAADIEEDIAAIGTEDLFALDRNAHLQQVAYRQQISAQRASARNYRRSANLAIPTSLLAGASRLV